MFIDWPALTDLLFATDRPWLPAPALQHWGLRLGWGLVLAALLLWFGRRRPGQLWPGLAGLLLLWCLVPGPVSPAYWLGLAFQLPSLMTGVLCLAWLGAHLRRRRHAGAGHLPPPAWLRALVPASLAGVALGWLLLLDTFAVLPVSLYAWGFSPAALGLAALAAGLPWVRSGSPRPGALLLGVVLLLYVLLRLPSGNLWDALLDPLLWLALHGFWLWRGLRWLKARRAAAATRV